MIRFFQCFLNITNIDSCFFSPINLAKLKRKVDSLNFGTPGHQKDAHRPSVPSPFGRLLTGLRVPLTGVQGANLTLNNLW